MGLMQPMGEVAREQGFDSTYLSALFEPFNSIDQGATLLKKLLTRYGHDTLAAISAYNQGSARRTHGTFENAQYVYRVSVAWRHYDKALHYAHTYRSTTQDPELARTNRIGTRDSGIAPTDSMQHKADSNAFAHDGNAGSIGAIVAGYDLGSRYTPNERVPDGKGKPHDGSSIVFEGLPADLYLGLAAFLSLVVLGLALDLRRYLRKRARYHLDLPRRSDRRFLSRSAIQPSPTDLSRAFHTHG